MLSVTTNSVWSSIANRTIFVWPWNENARTEQEQQANENSAIWLVYRTDLTNALGHVGWLSKRTIGRSNNTFSKLRVFFGGKTRSPMCFDVFIHWLIKQVTNTYRNHRFQGHTNFALRTCNWHYKKNKQTMQHLITAPLGSVADFGTGACPGR